MALLTSPSEVILICPEPPMMDPYIESMKKKVEIVISAARLAVVILEPK